MKSSNPLSAHCRSSKTRTVTCWRRKALEEESPCRVEVAWVGGRAFLEAHEVGETGLDPAALLGIGHEFLDGLAKLGPRRSREVRSR